MMPNVWEDVSIHIACFYWDLSRRNDTYRVFDTCLSSTSSKDMNVVLILASQILETFKKTTSIFVLV